MPGTNGQAEEPASRNSSPLRVPTLTQAGFSTLCGELAICQCVIAAGGAPIAATELYREMHALDYVPPGQPSSFPQMRTGILAAGKLSGLNIQLYGYDGCAYDLPTLDRLVYDAWYVIAGVAMAYIKPGADYYHFLTIDGYEGLSFVVSDPLNHDITRVPIANMHLACVHNWTGPFGPDCIAFKVNREE
jgi:hypothetical protein